MSRLVEIVTAADAAVRDTPIEAVTAGLGPAALLEEAAALDRFRRSCPNLYQRVRALFFLSAIHRYVLPAALGATDRPGRIPWDAYRRLLDRRYDEAIRVLDAAQAADGPSETLSSAFASAFRGLAFQTLADQVRHSVRSVPGNRWMFRMGHAADYPLRLRPELLRARDGVFPLLSERTPVRMDLSHSGWSDIFFLGMDFPEGARVLNISVDLAVRRKDGNPPEPPVQAHLRVIDEPVLRLVSVDLNARADISELAEVFDFARDYLGLLKAAVIASGLVPPGLEGSGQSLQAILARLTGRAGLGIEIVSRVSDIPKGSRLAVSTNLLACLITVCMRATGQITALSGGLEEDDRKLVAARAILGEWLGGSGGGWQDSGGVWPGIKVITGEEARPGDAEHGVSRGRLLPSHHVLDVPDSTRRLLQDSLVVVHGGMAQDVGPVLEMVTEKYLLRSEAEWRGRKDAMALFDRIVDRLKAGDVAAIADATQRNFDGPVQTIIPWAANRYTELLIERARAEFGDGFRGFWMLGGMSGGGMGFIFDPDVKPRAQERLREIMAETRRSLQTSVPFAMEPVVYDFAINDRGTWGELREGGEALMPAGYYRLVVPPMLRDGAPLTVARRAEMSRFGEVCRTDPRWNRMAGELLERLIPAESHTESARRERLNGLLHAHGFDPVQHEKIRADLRGGRIGLSQNALPPSSTIRDAHAGALTDPWRTSIHAQAGEEAIRSGTVAVVTLAGGIGTRWTRGAGVVKALNPFCRLNGRWRNFVEVHLAKTRRAGRLYGVTVPHVFTTSYMTDEPMAAHLRERDGYGFGDALILSPGASVGLRMVPMVRDLRYLWEELPQQSLDEQKQKVRDSLRAGLMQWARNMGEGSDYRDNDPLQCLHPVGHWYELPNMLLNGTLRQMLEQRPQLRWLMLHNLDTLGVTVDPACLGAHIGSGAVMSVEVIPRVVDDRGGGLASVDGRLRLVEGLALPSEELEFDLSYYNSGTMWIDIGGLLGVFGLTREDLADEARVAGAVRSMAARMPTYVTIKDVKKRWGRGQEDVFPVAQFEKLWGDMTALPELSVDWLAVPRSRGQQLKDVAQLDGWVRDGSAAHVASLCDWTDLDG